MQIYFTVVLFVIGTTIASFLNALLYRIDNGYKYPDIFVKGSHCEKCKKQLTWYELIPVLSYFIFKGKCTKCGYKIPVYYPVSEFVLGISFSLIYYLELPLPLCVLIIFLFIMSYFDRIYRGVPKVIVHIFLLISFCIFAIYTVFQNSIYPNSILISILFVSVIFIISKIMKKEFGTGDLLILLGIGFYISIPMYISYIFVFLCISLLYSFVLIFLKKMTIKSTLPLVPFMYISIPILLIFSKDILIILQNLSVI